MDETKLKEYIFQAVQAGKQETSGLVAHLERVMKKEIGHAVEKYVNGHIRDIKQHLEEQDKVLAELSPVLEAQKTTKSVGKFVMWVGGIAAAIWGIIKFITSFK